MAAPRICVLRAPGTNCDPETARAFELCGGRPEIWHLFRLLEQPDALDQFQILCIPGGFSYGDDVGSGVIFASHLRGKLAGAIERFLAAPKLVLGICNGFQVLLKAGILPNGLESFSSPRAETDSTLTWNANGKYTARWVRTRVGQSNSVFLKNLTELDLPIAHAEGRIAVADDSTLVRWAENRQAALTYIPWTTAVSPRASSDAAARTVSVTSNRWPANPNGSAGHLAGLSDPTGRVLGLMPHPERFLFGVQHPHWTRRGTGDRPGDGLAIFQNAVNYFA